MTVDDLLATNDYSLVLTLTVPVYGALNSQYPGWVGGTGVAQPLRHQAFDNSKLIVSTDAIVGLSTFDVLQRDFASESTIGREFDSTASSQISVFELLYDDDDIGLHRFDFENRPFTLEIGATGSEYSTFLTWVNGKTLSATYNTNGMEIDASPASVLTNALYPPNTFDTGDAKGKAIPRVVGSADKVTPARISAFKGRFHDGVVDTTDDELTVSPSASFQRQEEIVIGEMRYEVFTTSGSTEATATNSFPTDVTRGDGSILDQGDHIQVTIPDYNLFPPQGCIIECKQGNIGTAKMVRLEVDMEVDRSSTVDFVEFYGLGPTTFDFRLTKARQTAVTPWFSSVEPIANIGFSKKSTAENSETAIVNVYGARVVPQVDADSLIQAYDRSTLEPIATYRIQDANVDVAPTKYVVVYDDNGYCASGLETGSYVMDVVGSDRDILTIAALDGIASDATEGGVSITASFVGDKIGAYFSEQRPFMESVKSLCASLDLIVSPNLADDDWVVARRYNHQPTDFDGNSNTLDDFSLVEDDFVPGSVKVLVREAGEYRYTATYAKNHALPANSPSETTVNRRGNISKSRIIDTPLREEEPARKISSLVSRGASRVVGYSFWLVGRGLGIERNAIGLIDHRKIVRGVVHVLTVRPSKDDDATYFEVDVYV